MNIQSLPRPFLVSVVCEPDVDTVAAACQASRAEGAHIIEINLAQIRQRELRRLEEQLTRAPLPFYVVCRRRELMASYGYRRSRLETLSDAQRAARLKRFLNTAMGLDVELEMPERQRNALIRYAHVHEKQVIVSVHTNTAPSAEETVRLGLGMRDLGADAVKIVHRHSAPDYSPELWRAIGRLRQRLGRPFVLVSEGPGALLMRYLAGHLGCSYCLGRPSSARHFYPGHPPLAVLRQLLELVPFEDGILDKLDRSSRSIK